MNKQTVNTWFYRGISFLLALSYALSIATLGYLGILPIIYFFIIVILTAPLVVWLCVLTFKKGTPAKKRTIAAIVAIILGAIAIYLFVSLAATASFLANLNKPSATYQTYSVIAKKVRHLKLDSAKNAALIKNDTNEDAVKQELKKLTNAEQLLVAAPMLITNGLNDHSVDLGVMRDSQLELIKETDQLFYESIEVVATFKVLSTSPATSKVDITKPFIIYISGIDTYGKVETVSRSDVNMLAVVNPGNNKILLVNTPRDYYVQLHGTSGVRDKLTHAGVYGVDMSIKTLEDLYGVPIDSYMRVNFSSLISLVDTLGGVTVHSDYAFKSFSQGPNTLNGEQALEFSRERYSLAEGDRARGKNQQRVIEAIMKKINNPATLAHYTALLSNLESSLETNISGDKLATLANRQLENLKSWSFESVSVDGTSAMAPTYSMGSQPLYVIEPDAATVAAAKQKITQYLSQ